VVDGGRDLLVEPWRISAEPDAPVPATGDLSATQALRGGVGGLDFDTRAISASAGIDRRGEVAAPQGSHHLLQPVPRGRNLRWDVVHLDVVDQTRVTIDIAHCPTIIGHGGTLGRAADKAVPSACPAV
jgi:hypothetical protein